MTSPAWRPLLEQDLAERAWDTIRAISRTIESAPAVERSVGSPRSRRQISLSGGSAGRALLHGYLSKAAETRAEAQAHARLAEDCLRQASEVLADSHMSAGLYSGFTGVAWVAEHLKDVLPAWDEGDEDINEEIDEALLAALARSPWTGEFDLINGLVGFGVYALERYPRPLAVSCLEAVVDRLDEMAERHEQGVTWFTPPDLLPPTTREAMPLGCYYLGVAHGVPGVIALLAEVCRSGVRKDRALPLLEKAVSWFLAQRRPEDGGPSCFSSYVGPGVNSRPARLAWCYGDPGIAATLLLSARATGREDWEREALAIATRAIQVPLAASGIGEPGLCHGALGLAHLYNRIHQAGGGEPFAEAARLWYRRGLEMRSPERGFAGFSSWQAREDGQFGWVDDSGFLTGASGIGLSLLAGVTAKEPDWDRILLVSIPPRQFCR